MKESPYTISYGSGKYRFESGSLMCVAPGQRGGVTDDGETIRIKGWVLLFHPDLLAGTPLERRIKDYHYFSYYSNEALILTPDEWARLERCFAAIRKELEEFPEDSHLQAIVISYLSCCWNWQHAFTSGSSKETVVPKKSSAKNRCRPGALLCRRTATGIRNPDGPLSRWRTVPLAQLLRGSGPSENRRKRLPVHPSLF